jgi:hypothetical protein
LNGWLQKGELFFFEPPKLVHPLLLRGTGFREAIKPSQSGIDLRNRFFVGLQIDRIVRNQISTLACFHVDHKAKNGTQLFLHLVVSLNLIVQSVIAQGGSAGVRNHPEGEAQPNSEDDYQALLQSG